MPVYMDWDNPERTVIRVTFEGAWGTEDIYRMIVKGISMLESVDHPVDSIFDMSQSTFLPSHLLPTAETMETMLHHNHRLAILVKANIYIRSLLRVGKIFAPRALANLHFVDTLDEAYSLINQHPDIIWH